MKTAGAAARPKADQAEPFFRPFSKLNTARSKKIAEKQAAEKAKVPAAKPPPQSDPPRAAVPAQPEDPHTFAVYMSGVHALPGGRAGRIPLTANQLERSAAGAPSSPTTADPDDDARSRMRSLVSDGLRFETVDDGERLEGRRIDVDPRELRRLRRGQYAVDGRIDLHGLGADEARHAIETFIKKRAREGDHAVLIVHGKGNHSPRGHAVLRGEIAAWLSQGRSARHIAAFTTAPDEHGGTGAVLVLLAR